MTCGLYAARAGKKLRRPMGHRAQQLAAFSNAMFQIANCIRLFLSLPIDKVDPMSLQKQLGELNLPSDS